MNPLAWVKAGTQWNTPRTPLSNTKTFMCKCGGSWDDHRHCAMVASAERDALRRYPEYRTPEFIALAERPAHYCLHKGHGLCECTDFRPA